MFVVVIIFDVVMCIKWGFWWLEGLLCIWIVDGRKFLELGFYFKLEIEWVCFIYVLCGEIGCN